MFTLANKTDDGVNEYVAVWLDSLDGTASGVTVTVLDPVKPFNAVILPLKLKVGASFTGFTVSVKVCVYVLLFDCPSFAVIVNSCVPKVFGFDVKVTCPDAELNETLTKLTEVGERL